MESSNEIKNKDNKLDQILGQMDNAVIAFSGGVDSSFLLYKAVKVLGTGRVIAVTADSPLYPEEELENARRITSGLNVKHLIVTTDELSIKEFAENPPERCYYCKKEFFGRIGEIAVENNYNAVLDGSNSDDDNDFRPGTRAALETGVLSPLKDASLKKDEIRVLSRQYGLDTWDKPSAACLASRFPYGERILPAKIEQVKEAERALRSMGFEKDMRVRSHGNLARIEVGADEMFMLLKKRSEVLKKFEILGFYYVTMDMDGFKSGSMNRVLNKRDYQRPKYIRYT